MEQARRFRVVATGTGRCGPKFVSKLLTSAGVKCGHETIFTHRGLGYAYQLVMGGHWQGLQADSSWQAAPYLQDDLLRDTPIIHLMRHPQAFIESVMKIWPGRGHTPWTAFVNTIIPRAVEYDDDRPTWLAFRYAKWVQMIEAHLQHREHIQFNIERDPDELVELLDEHGIIDLAQVDRSQLYKNRKCNTQLEGRPHVITLADIKDAGVRDDMLETAARYGYSWPTEAFFPVPKMPEAQPTIKAIITTLDNLPNLKETVAVLHGEPLAEIIVVDNGSQDDTAQWLAEQDGLTAVIRENLGAGPGRNAGLDVAGEFDYVLMLDGGIRPLRGGTAQMLDYLRRTPGADVIGVEIADFETDREKAWRRWPEPIAEAYHNTRLSHTAYALCRARAWDGLRFCEEGPFGEPGWGADDDEMAYQWTGAGITVHVVTCACRHGKECTGVHPYRRAAGSFRRLYNETGVWPTNYGSVYEKRVVWLQQNWPKYQPGLQWGEPWLTVVVKAGEVDETAMLVKRAHDELRKRKLAFDKADIPNPYAVAVWCNGSQPKVAEWAEARRLRQHHGDRIVADGEAIGRTPENEETWTGDFHVWTGTNWRDATPPGTYYYSLIRNQTELDALLEEYNAVHPPKRSWTETPPDHLWELLPIAPVYYSSRGD